MIRRGTRNHIHPPILPVLQCLLEVVRGLVPLDPELFLVILAPYLHQGACFYHHLCKTYIHQGYGRGENNSYKDYKKYWNLGNMDGTADRIFFSSTRNGIARVYKCHFFCAPSVNCIVNRNKLNSRENSINHQKNNKFFAFMTHVNHVNDKWNILFTQSSPNFTFCGFYSKYACSNFAQLTRKYARANIYTPCPQYLETLGIANQFWVLLGLF